MRRGRKHAGGLVVFSPRPPPSVPPKEAKGRNTSARVKSVVCNEKENKSARSWPRPPPNVPPGDGNGGTSWHLHDIAIANIVWCMAFKGGVGGGACIARWACNSIAIRYACRWGGQQKEDGLPR